MYENKERSLDLLKELGARPAVPFFEMGPSQFIFDTLSQIDVSVKRDVFGNIVAHYRKDPLSNHPPLVFVSHMDHPGFEVVGVDGQGGVARPLGGVPESSLTKETSCLVLTTDGWSSAILKPIDRCDEDRMSKKDRIVQICVDSTTRLGLGDPIVFDLPNFEMDGTLIKMRALDDLAGCAAVISAFEQAVSQSINGDVYGVFTRAEEEGLLGSRLIAETGALPGDSIIVSIESSPIIPGVIQGGGPVIRTGDAAYTFDSYAEQVLLTARDVIRARNSDFGCQRHLMSGGVCEATAFKEYGYNVTGIAFPLGNYHNASTSVRDPKGDIQAEYIDLSDFLGGIELIAETIASFDLSDKKRQIKNVPKHITKRLERTSDSGRYKTPEIRLCNDG